LNTKSRFSRLSIEHKVAVVLLAIAGAVLAISAVSMIASSLVSCVPSEPSASTGQLKPSGKPQKGLKTATLRVHNLAVVVELAVSPAEQETGLMHRTELEDGAGMLFVYTADRRLSFWMKNTLIPLSIAYLGADGTIKELHDMEPLSLAGVQSERYVRYALEAPLGWFARVGLKPGDRFDLSELSAAP
jgi:uncharacterized membrane protein (UPF0127 family)